MLTCLILQTIDPEIYTWGVPVIGYLGWQSINDAMWLAMFAKASEREYGKTVVDLDTTSPSVCWFRCTKCMLDEP